MYLCCIFDSNACCISVSLSAFLPINYYYYYYYNFRDRVRPTAIGSVRSPTEMRAQALPRTTASQVTPSQALEILSEVSVAPETEVPLVESQHIEEASTPPVLAYELDRSFMPVRDTPVNLDESIYALVPVAADSAAVMEENNAMLIDSLRVNAHDNNTTVTGSVCIRYSRIWHDPVIFPVIGPSVLSTANQNASVMTQYANSSRPKDCIAAHYKIVPIKIADKLAIKIICDKNGVYVLFCSLYEHHI